MTENKRNTRFFGLWTIIEDDQSVLRGLRATQYVAFFLTFGSLLQIVILLLSGETAVSFPPSDRSQLYFELGLFSLLAALFLWLGLRIRKGKFGAVPYICVLMLLEILFNLLTEPWRGLLGAAIFGTIAVSGMRAWFVRKKFGVAVGKVKRNWFLLAGGAVVGVPLFLMLGLGVLIETGVFPYSQVVAGDKLPEHQIQTLVEHAILDKDDEIEFFYSEGVYSVALGGQFLTPSKLVIYEELDGELSVFDIPCPQIDSVELVVQGGFFEDSLYRVNGKPNSDWTHFFLYLSVENGGDQLFIDRLRTHLSGS